MIRIARAPFASPRRQGGLGVRATAARPRLPTSNRETAVGKVATPEATRDELITTECGLGIGAVHAAQGNGKPRLAAYALSAKAWPGAGMHLNEKDDRMR